MNRLKELRTKYGLSLRKLQQYTGIDFSRLAIIEKTEANLETKTLNKLTEFFKVSDTYFFGKDGFIYYYNEKDDKYFPMAYGQYKSILTDNVIKWSIVNGQIRRIILSEGRMKINSFDLTNKQALNARIITERYKEFLDSLDLDEFAKQKDEIQEYFKLKEAVRKKDE